MTKSRYGQRPIISTSPVDGYAPIGLGALTVYVNPQSNLPDAVRSAMQLQADLYGGDYHNGVLVERLKQRKMLRSLPMCGALTEPQIREVVSAVLNSRKRQ